MYITNAQSDVIRYFKSMLLPRFNECTVQKSNLPIFMKLIKKSDKSFC